jgi:hypothetical protein
MPIKNRRVHAVVAMLAGILVVMAIAGPIGAASPESVTLVSHVTFNPDGPNYGDFDASGDAVDTGLICGSGTFVDTGIRFAGYQSDRGIVQLQVVKEFTCDDGTGTLVVLSGTGEYRSLHASGSGSTVPNAPIGNINTYEGFVLN